MVDIGAFQTSLVVESKSGSVDTTAPGLTLPGAVSLADQFAGSAINFDPTVFTQLQTITLAAQLELNNTALTTSIAEPAVRSVTISGGGGQSRVFPVDGGVTAALSGLQIIGGKVAANASGGGLYNEGKTTLTDCTISGNVAGFNGGGLFNAGTGNLTLNECNIGSDSAQAGGGLYNAGSAYLTLNHCFITDDSAGSAAGLSNFGAASLLSCTISGNSTGGFGGGLSNYSAKDLTLTDCTVTENSAGQYGGGLFNDGQAKLTDCTVSGNSAGSKGGGLYNTVMEDLSLIACTISRNSAGQYGGGLYNNGTAKLTDTIVAGNTRPSAPSDIHENGTITGSNNLIGPGGSGPLEGGEDGNIVLTLTSLSSLGLADLGSYGGPTQTMALLPGSEAIGMGTPVSGLTFDQRGRSPLDSGSPDIGAFQNQGFTLSVVGGTPQSSTINTAFADPFSVSVTADDPEEPVAGGVISFAAPSGGASAALSSDTAAIGSDGVASVTATANSSVGTYAIAASTFGAGAAADFDLANLAIPTVTVVDVGGSYDGSAFGATATVAGADGIAGPSLEGVMPAPAYFAGGTATGTPLPGAPTAPGTYTVTATFPGSVDYLAVQAAPVTFQIDPASPTLAVIASSGPAVYGQAVTFTATVMAPGGTPTGTVTFSDGGTVLGTAALDSSGTATITASSMAVGAHSITATYGGDADLMSATSAPTSAVSVAKAGSQVVLVPMAVKGNKKEVSLEAEIEPLSPGAGVPTGTVTFEVRKNKKHELTLVRLVLGRGEAALVVNSKKVHKKSITIAYGGDADFQASTLTTTLTSASLVPTARPMVRLSMQR